jgi:arginase family enzyme
MQRSDEKSQFAVVWFDADADVNVEMIVGYDDDHDAVLKILQAEYMRYSEELGKDLFLVEYLPEEKEIRKHDFSI